MALRSGSGSGWGSHSRGLGDDGRPHYCDIRKQQRWNKNFDILFKQEAEQEPVQLNRTRTRPGHVNQSEQAGNHRGSVHVEYTWTCFVHMEPTFQEPGYSRFGTGPQCLYLCGCVTAPPTGRLYTLQQWSRFMWTEKVSSVSVWTRSEKTAEKRHDDILLFHFSASGTNFLFYHS